MLHHTHGKMPDCFADRGKGQYSLRVTKHLASDRASHIFKHLENSEPCRALCYADYFYVLGHASTSFQLKKKEAIHI